MPEDKRDEATETDVAVEVERLLARMTLDEKLAQLTMAENNSITPEQVKDFKIGAVLSGGGGNPTPNTPASWREMVCGFQAAALQTRLGIPLLYGVDAVHGHNNVRGAVIFPHNIGLGAARGRRPGRAHRRCHRSRAAGHLRALDLRAVGVCAAGLALGAQLRGLQRG